MTHQATTGGRFGRTPYQPDDLTAQYATTDSGRLHVTCSGCGREWYPSPLCCVHRRAGTPFCPDCGTDFRVGDATHETHYQVHVTAQTDTAATALHTFITDHDDLTLVSRDPIRRDQPPESSHPDQEGGA